MSLGIAGLLSSPSPATPEFFWWQGASGRSWITTIFPICYTGIYLSSVYVMVRRNPDGSRVPLYIGQTDNTERRMSEHARSKLFAAMILGGNELHLHFLADTERERLAIETDLRHGHATPLNQQLGGGLMGLASLYGR